jgi:hypothetical protein
MVFSRFLRSEAGYSGRILLLILIWATFCTAAADTVAHWRFEEGQPGNPVPPDPLVVLDASGNGNHLRTFSTATAPVYLSDRPFARMPLTAEPNRLCLIFWPNRDLYSSGRTINGQMLSAWTVEASFKPFSINRFQVIVGKDGNPIAGAPPLSMKILATTGRLEIGLVDGSGVARFARSLAPLEAGRWYSAAATATSSELSLWLKGDNEESYQHQETVGIDGAFFAYSGFSRPWTIGRGQWNGSNTDWFDGLVDEVRVSSGALNPDAFLASAARATADAAELQARPALSSDGRLALEVRSPGLHEILALQGSADLVAWTELAYEQESAEDSGAGERRLRLVSSLDLAQLDRHFLRAKVEPLPPPEAQPRNPIMAGADPDILLDGDKLWLYPTFRSAEGLLFAFSTQDLVNWTMHGPILRFSEIPWIPSGKSAWAPGIAKRHGKYYLYYSVGPKPSFIGVAVADSPAGPFVDSGAALLADNGTPGFEAIDAMVYMDPLSGNSYFYAGGSAGSTLRIFRMAEDMVRFAEEIPVATPPFFTEGAFVHWREGTYYLTYSHGSFNNDSYSVHYATSSSPVGPWIYRGRILSSDERHKGPGHHSILQIPGTDEWYIIYHRWNDRSGSGPYSGTRSVAIERLQHELDGSINPVVMTDQGVGPVQLADPQHLPEVAAEAKDCHDTEVVSFAPETGEVVSKISGRAA